MDEIQNRTEEKRRVEFDEALSFTGYGKFNKSLLFRTIPVALTTLFSTSSVSFILPIALCHLNLSAQQVGLLNGAVYAGMVSSAFFWGFLADTVGRKIVLKWSLLFTGLSELSSGFMQNYTLLLTMKFVAGFFVSAPFSLLFTYHSEFVSSHYKDLTTMRVGTITSFTIVLQPILALLVIPQTWIWDPYGDDSFILTNWKIYLMLCSLPSLIGFIAISTLPETPKFLLSHGRSKEALAIIKKIYAVNTGNSKESYPVQSIYLSENEMIANNRNKKSTKEDKKKFSCSKFINFIMAGCDQFSPLFKRPYGIIALITFVANMINMSTQNSVRLMLPNLYAYTIRANNDRDMSLCELWDEGKKNNSTNMCSFAIGDIGVPRMVYVYSIVCGSVTIVSFFAFTYLVKKFGKVRTYSVSQIVAAICISLYPMSRPEIALALSSLYVGIMQSMVSIVIGVAVSCLPSSLRAMTTSLIMMNGRIAAIFGNFFISVSLTNACMESFFGVAFLNLCAAPILLFLPSERKITISAS